MSEKRCSFSGCATETEARGLCAAHYTQLLRGEPLREKRPRGAAPREQLWRLVSPEPNTGCWLWTGTTNALGYGRVTMAGQSMAAHRASFVAFRGPIPAGLELDHLCRNPSCVNPAHLEPVTHRTNILRSNAPPAAAAVAIACPAGHPYDERNTHRNHLGHRRCRACDRRRRAAKRGAA